MSPILVLKSPHIMDFSCGGICSKMALTEALAVFSSICLRDNELAGGKYTLAMLTLLLSGNCTFITYAYSFPSSLINFSLFLTYMAIPPLFPESLLCSLSIYPGIDGARAVEEIHISCKHRMSKSDFTNIKYNFK